MSANPMMKPVEEVPCPPARPPQERSTRDDIITLNELGQFLMQVTTARQAIIQYGLNSSSTKVGDEEHGLCVGSAMAFASGQTIWYGLTVCTKVEFWNWTAYSSAQPSKITDGVCAQGRLLIHYLMTLGVIDTPMVASWNDANVNDASVVVDALAQVALAVSDDMLFYARPRDPETVVLRFSQLGKETTT